MKIQVIQTRKLGLEIFKVLVDGVVVAEYLSRQLAETRAMLITRKGV